MKERRIQIPYDLYHMMVLYICDHYDSLDSERYTRILDGIHTKEEAVLRHQAYTTSKVHADPEKREQARQQYLDLVGMRDSFRWPAGWTLAQERSLADTGQDNQDTFP